MPGVLYIVGTPIGNLEDMTFRAVRVLGEVDTIAAEDTRSARRLLSHFEIATPRLQSLFEGNEATRTHALVEELAAGHRVAVISEAGMPCVSDPGQRLVEAARLAGIRVEVVPGPAACMAAVAGSGLPTDAFLFVGFLPREQGARQERLGQLRGQQASIVIYESPERVAATLADIAAAFGAERPCVLARELTKVHEEWISGGAAQLAEQFRRASPRGECTLVVAGADGELPQIDIEAQVRSLLQEGLGPKDVAARLVVKTGKPRRQLYQLALSLRRDSD